MSYDWKMSEEEFDDFSQRQQHAIRFWKGLALGLATIFGMLMALGGVLALSLVFRAAAPRFNAEHVLREAEAIRKNEAKVRAQEQLAEQHTENQQTREIERLGGKVTRDGWRSGNPVVAVNLAATKVADTDLARLSAFTHLESLDLTRTAVTNSGLTHVTGMKNLGMLYLDDTKITDTGLEALKGMEQLWELSLENTQVTDAGIAHLVGIKKLQSLSLGGTAITDKAVVSLKKLRQLDYLDLADTHVTVDGRIELRRAFRDAKIFPRQVGE